MAKEKILSDLYGLEYLEETPLKPEGSGKRGFAILNRLMSPVGQTMFFDTIEELDGNGVSAMDLAEFFDSNIDKVIQKVGHADDFDSYFWADIGTRLGKLLGRTS